MSHPINVVGSGLAGSIAARVLRSRGHEVRVIDGFDKHSASRASSNLFIDHWLKKFKDKGATKGVQVLNELYGDWIEQPFANGLSYAMKVKHIPQRHILERTDIMDTVESVREDGVWCSYYGHQPGRTIVCTGWRGRELLPLTPEIHIKVGHAFLFEGQLREEQPRLAIVSPYKHEKLYQYDENRIYYADSVAVKPEQYEKRKEELRERTWKRSQVLIGKRPILEFRVGYRPIMPEYDFGQMTRHGKNIWSINGGGKNGMVAYAAMADDLEKEIRRS